MELSPNERVALLAFYEKRRMPELPADFTILRPEDYPEGTLPEDYQALESKGLITLAHLLIDEKRPGWYELTLAGLTRLSEIEPKAAGEKPPFILPFAETNHSYYMSEGSYFKNGYHTDFRSFAEFWQNWHKADTDYNRIHRFDITDPLEEEARAQFPDSPLELKCYFVLQRKAITLSAYCMIQRSDMPAVTDLLYTHFLYNQRLWGEFMKAELVPQSN